MDEHAPEGTLVKQVTATDADVDDVISYEIVPSKFSEAFTVSRLGEIFVSSKGPELVDRELMEEPFIMLSIKATDSEASSFVSDMTRAGYTSVKIRIRDVNDVSPKFEQKNYDINVHAPLRAQQEIIRVVAHGGDKEDDTDRMHYKIVDGNEEGTTTE